MKISSDDDSQSNEGPITSGADSKLTGVCFAWQSLLPLFNRERALIDGNFVLLSGPTKLMNSIGDNDGYADVFLELHVPCRLRANFCSPIVLAVYDSPDRIELIEIIILSDGTHKAFSERTRALEFVLGTHSFRFRSPEECRLWFALMGDVKVASTARIKELTDSKDSTVPRGYRTQYAELRRSIPSTLNKFHVGTRSASRKGSSVLSQALSCIDYLTSRLEHCRCSNNVSLDMEDSVYETRERISKLIGRGY